MANFKKNNKASNAELDIMLELVIEMLIKGQSRTDILRYFANDENKEHTSVLNKSERSVDYYISKARDEIKSRFKPHKEKLTSLALAKFDNLYKKNYQIQDYRECRQIIDSLSKLAGLNETEKIDLTTQGKSLVSQIDYTKLSDEVLEAIINAEVTNKK